MIAGTPGGLSAQEPATSARRTAATLHLAAQEYGLGVRDGRVVAPAEVSEARLFLAEAMRTRSALPADLADSVEVGVRDLESMVTRAAPPDSVRARAERLIAGLSRGLGVVLDEVPAAAPSVARGAEVYRAECAKCHGPAGRGDGPAALGLDPRPASLADSVGLADRSPLDFYRRITIGVAGTAMPSYDQALSAADRWAVALYASTLRLPPPNDTAPAALRDFQETARLSDSALLVRLGSGATRSVLAAVRHSQGTGTQSGGDAARVFVRVRGQLDSAFVMAEQGRPEAARSLAMDAYMTFEQVERTLQVKDPALAARAERAFADFRDRAGSAGNARELAGPREELARAVERSEQVLLRNDSPSNLFMQSFVILIREGLEAILVIGALTAFLVRTGNADRRRGIHYGVGAAVLMSLLTAAAIETIFILSPSHQEGLEGGVMVVAAATLFYVSYWLLSKLEVAKWNRFVKSKVEQALTRGSAAALASVAFLAVYREGFETVLFYKALAVSAGVGSTAWGPIGAGIAAGAVVLGVVYVAINRFGVRLPLKPLFGVTSALLYYMAVVFAGKGVAELQESGLVSLSPVAGAPRLPALGVYPTMESLAVQVVLLGLAAVALLWIFAVEPRRNRRAREETPADS